MDRALSRLVPPAATAAGARGPLPRLSARERAVCLAALVVAPLWFGAQLSFNASLARTSVTSNTILSTASSLFTYALAVGLLGEPATRRRAAAVAACVAGVVAVALADSLAARGGGKGGSAPSPSPSPPPPSSPPSPRSRTLAGDALVLLSCTLYAGYTVAVRALLVDEDGGAATVRRVFSGRRRRLPLLLLLLLLCCLVLSCSTFFSPFIFFLLGNDLAHKKNNNTTKPQMLFFGCVGLINLVSGLPLVALALVPGARIFSAAGRAAALDPRLLAAAAAKGLLDNVLSDYLWARAVLLIGPTVATVGLNVQVPLAAGLDAALGRPRPSWTRSAGAAALTAAGAVAVVGGVCGIAAE